MAQEQAQDDSIFDFLYVDRQRLASLLAQLSDDGVITLAKRTSSSSTSNNGKFKVGPSAIASAEGGVTDGASEGLERQFDSSFLLPINALTILQQTGRIKDESQLTLGSIVQISGKVNLRDLDLIKRLWDPFTKTIIGNAPSHKKAKVKHEIDIAGSVLKEIPPTVQVKLRTATNDFWGMLNDSDPTFSSHFIALKHGGTLQGEWYIVGILDALPDQAPSESDEMSGNLIADMAEVVNGLRELVGRPYSAFGITPLAIFRPCGEK
ncbi:DUF6414 family protein [Dyella tabacisoli]|uniref:Uncharacterized protein n=1 Tax=Dyella tabacisoli TaxID=2282381 RepID=A0A369UHB3_9GAMM|nr:hypothetical protein [Dyella tabacisoli]RDD79936.1 hypothetical protein DVJ77_20075 [Dyella tabacisoli]